jgi:hypothetical protein
MLSATDWTVRWSNSGGGEIFRTCPDRTCVPPNFLNNGYRVFPGDRKRPGRDVDPSPLIQPRSKKSRTIPLLSLRAFMACEKGKTYLLKLNLIVYPLRLKLKMNNEVSTTWLPMNIANFVDTPTEGGTRWRSGWGTALQTTSSQDRFPMVSLEFFIDITLPAALWPWGRLSL